MEESSNGNNMGEIYYEEKENNKTFIRHHNGHASYWISTVIHLGTDP